MITFPKETFPGKHLRVYVTSSSRFIQIYQSVADITNVYIPVISQDNKNLFHCAVENLNPRPFMKQESRTVSGQILQSQTLKYILN